MSNTINIKLGGDLIPPSSSGETEDITPLYNNDGTVTVSFPLAIDNESPDVEIAYVLYRSAEGNFNVDMSTPELCRQNGTIRDSGKNTSTLKDRGLKPGDEYRYNVVVMDEAGNEIAYNAATLGIIDNNPPTLVSASLSTSNLSETSFNVEYQQATDDGTDQADLVYSLYTSPINNLHTDASTVESNGTLQSTGTGVNTLLASGFNAGDTVWFNVVVEDEFGNKTIYQQNDVTTTDVNDTEAPVPGNSGTLDIVNRTTSSFDVSYTEATDNESLQSNLEYVLYSSSQNNISTVSECESFGTVEDSGFGLSLLSVTGLTEGQSRYVNVVVTDENGNKAVYNMRQGSSLISSGGGSRAGDEAALEDLYVAANGSSWTNNTGWGSSGMSLSNTIYGVTTQSINGELRVTQIELNDNNLTGSINTNTLSNLTEVTLFAVYYNSLNTQFPAGLMELPKLRYCYLSMTGNFSGEMGNRHPHEWSADDGINQEIHVGKEKGSEDNVITGTIPAPSNPGAMSIEWFMCNWTDTISSNPPETNGDGIQNIELGFFDITTFVTLQIYNNSGIALLDWPTAIGNMHDLFILSLGCGKAGLQSGYLSGSIPGNLENLTQLRYLILGGNTNLTIDFDVTDFRQFNLRQLEGSFTDTRGTFPPYMTDGSQQDLVFFILSWPTGPGMTGTVAGPLSPDDESIQGCMLTGHDLDSISPDFWNHLDLINQNFAYNRNLTTIGTDDLTALGSQFWKIRNLRWYNCNVRGRWPNLAWGTTQVEDLTRFQVYNNAYNFEDILWIPSQYNPDNDTIYDLYVAHGASIGGWISFQVSGHVRGQAATYEVTAGADITLNDFEGEFSHANNSYQWEKDGSNLTGETSKTLTISNADASDEGDYILKVTNPGAPQVGTIESAIITIEVA